MDGRVGNPVTINGHVPDVVHVRAGERVRLRLLNAAIARIMALRFEADADGLDHVTVTIPRGHPAADDLTATGYDLANDDDSSYIYGLTL